MVVVLFFFFFFCQAEDGIRDLVRSRGLGDVYKRQVEDRERLIGVDHPSTLTARANLAASYWQAGRTNAVSYTHLTLPTSDLV